MDNSFVQHTLKKRFLIVQKPFCFMKKDGNFANHIYCGVLASEGKKKCHAVCEKCQLIVFSVCLSEEQEPKISSP